MRTRIVPTSTFLTTALLTVVLVSGIAPAAVYTTADHTSCAAFSDIPESVIEEIKTDYSIFYGHTSHGSQIVTGMDMVYEENPALEYGGGPGTLQLHEYSDDLGHNGDVSWVPITEAYLDNASYDFNIVMWSWCGGCSDNTETGINTYLNAMNQLELDYPDVVFIYMTGHLDGSGDAGNLRARNNQIRAYCETNKKVLFDFADIESWDPDGTYYPDEYDGCAWCSAWCAVHECPSCGGCAHSHCFNCYQKGKAFWWLLGAVRSGLETGVNPGTATDPDDMGTLRVSLGQNSPNPFNPRTEISFSLIEPAHVTVEVLSIAGRCVTVLHDGGLGVGEHTVVWDGTDGDGRSVASGAYFYRLRSDGAAEMRRMILLK
ncbi:T9SS type A sorting domain-containing protein [bacterium]|nr:T9SS type A sorting domain-containing protein [bacterium]